MEPEDIAKAEEVLAESRMMIPNAKGRADTAIEDVKTFLETNAGDADLAGELGAPVVEESRGVVGAWK